MKELKLKGMVLKIHDGDVDEMPIDRYQKFNHNVAIEAGIGSDLSKFDQHLVRMKTYVKHDKKKDFLAEVENIRQCLHFVIQGISPRMAAFVYLIEEIDGVPLEDFSDSNVERLTKRLGRKGLTARLIDQTIALVKKNVEGDLADRFPAIMNDPLQAELNYRIGDRTRVITKAIMAGEDVEDLAVKVDKIDMDLLGFSKTSVYGGKDGIEVKMILLYERTVALVGEMIGRDAKQLTIMEYYTNVDILKQRHKASEKANRYGK